MIDDAARLRRVSLCLPLLAALSACASSPASAPSAALDAPPPLASAPRDYRPADIAPTAAVPEEIVLRGATIMTAAGPPIVGGDLWLRAGKIERVSATPIPAAELGGAPIVDLTGSFITPGLIDTHSHLGVYPTPHLAAHEDGNEMTGATTPQVDAAHSIWPQDPGFERALAGGITALQILPGSANLIGGKSATLQMRPGISAEAMRFPGAPGGIKMACGENPKRVYGGKGAMPSTRMGNMAVWRQTFLKAEKARADLDKYERALSEWARLKKTEKERPEPPARDLGAETLGEVLSGERLVHVHCYRADEMLQVLQLAEEFGFRVRSFHHAVEAYKIRDVLAAWEVSVSTWADWWGFKIEAHDAIMENAGLLTEAGARAIIHSDSAIDIQRLNQEASKAYWAARHAGVEVSELEALRWITANAAWALGIDDLTGTIERGKRADIAVWDRHPFSVYASATLVFVGGVREYDRDAPARWSDFEAARDVESIKDEEVRP